MSWSWRKDEPGEMARIVVARGRRYDGVVRCELADEVSITDGLYLLHLAMDDLWTRRHDCSGSSLEALAQVESQMASSAIQLNLHLEAALGREVDEVAARLDRSGEQQAELMEKLSAAERTIEALRLELTTERARSSMAVHSND